MSRNLMLRALVVAGVVVISTIYLVPTFVTELPGWWSKVLPSDRLRLGLDLKGGMHLVLGVQLDKAVEASTERTAQQLKNTLKRKRLGVAEVKRDGLTGIVIGLTGQPGPEIREEIALLTGFETASEGDGQIVLKMLDTEVTRIKQYAIDQGKETIQNRVDQFGVAEATIIKQGTDRIVVELPGVKDPKRAVQLIGKTALLEFKMLDEEHSVEEAVKGNVPPAADLLYEVQTDPVSGRISKTPYLVKSRTELTGDVLTDAKVEIDSQFNRPYVSIEFDRKGAALFADITAENVGKRLAIVLDGNVYSAPVIQEKIPDGKARITGQFSMEEARDLAIVLRAGALPAPVEILENRTVGPSLGADLVRNGLTAAAIGSLLVVGFMVIYYRLSGVVAVFALVLNLLILLAALAGFKAALTLPGIAGLVLTIGMAVDANVLIYERMREELRWGRGIAASVENGYNKAFSAIFDGNLTTIMTALILWVTGTGPIRGFAVTLFLGLVANLFTAVFVTRIIFDYFLYKRKISTLSI